jgi:hypothetical protein
MNSVFNYTYQNMGARIVQSVKFLATGWTTGVQFPTGAENFFLRQRVQRPALRSTQPPIQWVPAVLPTGVKQPGCEADDSPPSSAEVKNAWSYSSTPQ